MMNKSKIDIILVDDHQIVRDGLKSLLADSDQVEIIGEAQNAEELFVLLKKQQPHIILLDISLPTMSGIEVAKVLTADFRHIKILMLSMYTSYDFVFNALKAGVKGYLPKNTTRDELLLAIREIYHEREYFSKSIADIILKSYMSNMRHANTSPDAKLNSLTQREHEILVLVVDGIKNPEIAKRLCISTRTVETHKTSIMRKLCLSSTVDLVKFAIKNKIIKL